MCREGDAATLTGDEVGADELGEAPHRRAHRGLRDVEADRGSREAALLRHHREDAEQVQIEISPITVSDFPELDVLVNNAGVMRKMNLHVEQADIAEEIDINLTGSIRMVMQFLPHLRAQPSAAIVNVSSGLAFNPYPIAPIYGATKAGIHSFTQSLRVQLKNTNIKVFELAPPVVDTPLSQAFAEDLKGTPLMSVTKLVDEAMKGLEKDRLEIRVGFANVLSIMSRLAPGFILKQLSKPVDRMLALEA